MPTKLPVTIAGQVLIIESEVVGHLVDHCDLDLFNQFLQGFTAILQRAPVDHDPIGLERNRKIGERGKLDMKVAYVKNFGPNISDEKKEFWDFDVNLSFGF